MLPAATSGPRPGVRETVALLAMLMAINSMAIDAMIPALPAIGRDLGVASANSRQLVVIAYMAGFGFGHLGWGPLADRFGRKTTLGIGVGLYAGFALLCGVSTSFEMLIAGRLAMGMSAAVTRVLATAMVRDLFEGEAMARVMSLVSMTFMVVPMIAPTLGQAILLVAPWRAIFVVFAGFAGVMWWWSFIRLPETLHEDFRRSLDPRDVAAAIRMALTDRLSLGYTLALTALTGALVAYISSIQQIVFDVFHRPAMIGLIFAAIAAPMVLSSFTNSRIIERFGLRRVGHGGLIAYVVVASINLVTALTGTQTIASFIVLMGLTMASFSLCGANFSTLAMTNMAEIAGTASSVQGLVSTVFGAAIGFAIGQAFDGTVIPFLVGLVGCGAAALALTAITERGRLLRPLNAV